MNQSYDSVSAVLDSCAAEPIRIPGAIQPQAALLCIDPESLTIRQYSRNLPELLRLPVEAGINLAALPGTEALLDGLRGWLDGSEPVLLRVMEIGGRRWQLHGHRTGQGAILECEPPPRGQEDSLESLYPRLRGFMADITGSADLTSVAQAAVREIRALTLYNRVMLYSFDETGVGTVLAEDSDGALPSYLGQRFPAADIPEQARALYRLNRVRLIPDVDYEPVPIEPAASPVDGKPLDLSFAMLRSLSPVHREYMRNMGTAASMSVSIIVDGKLWGLISAHNGLPKAMNAQIRSACDILGQVLSMHIETRLQAGLASERHALAAIQQSLLTDLAEAANFQDRLEANGAAWRAMMKAGGAAIITQAGLWTTGVVPAKGVIERLAGILYDKGKKLTHTDSLAEIMPEAEDFGAVASGMMAISISQVHPDYIFWFRPELVRTLEWTGDPAKAKEPVSGRLHPRKSFDLWKEQVVLRSAPWREAEIEAAESFRNAIQTLVLRRAEERAQLTDALERSNNELEAFSYSISHDLRAPFRHIVGFAELLSDREQALDERSRHYIATIQDAAISAGRLVDSLLAFSHIGRAQLSKTRVDMGKLVQEVQRLLIPQLEGRQVEWDIGALPDAWGDPTMLRQVWQNLLENAVKYSRDREMTRISVAGGTGTGAELRYWVRDNGAGFEMRYVSKLFGVFQRLHRADEFEGTGIGLALVKRIVERHGGVVEAEGKPGEGACFTFTLPPAGVQKEGN